jgi:hypothetical protein
MCWPKGFQPVLRIRDVYSGSRIEFFPSRIRIFPIPDPPQRIKKILTQKMVTKNEEI